VVADADSAGAGSGAEERPTARRLSPFLPHLVAIVAVVSSAVVAVTVPFINSGLERDRLEWQTNETKREEFRNLLNGSTERLWQAYQLTFDAADAVSRPEVWRVRKQRLATAATTLYEKIGMDTLRIGMVVGDKAPVTERHSRAANVFARIEADLRDAVLNGNLEEKQATFGSESQELISAVGEFRNKARQYFEPTD
jgi:hypothetical protein